MSNISKEIENISTEMSVIRKELQEFRYELINTLVRIAVALEKKNRY